MMKHVLPSQKGGPCGIRGKRESEIFSPGKAYQVRDRLAWSLLARPFRRPTGCDLLCGIVVVFSLPAFSGAPLLFAAFRLYRLQHVLAKYPPYPPRIYIIKKELIPIIFISSFFPAAHCLRTRSRLPPSPGLSSNFMQLI